MQLYYNNISELLQNKYCPLCQQKLKVILTNFIDLSTHGFNFQKTTLKNNQFKFNVKSNNIYSLKGYINIINNTLTLKINKLHNNSLINLFKLLAPHIELYCSSNPCKSKYKYYAASNSLQLHYIKHNTFQIVNTQFYMESFILNNLWIQNDWINKSLNIINLNKQNYTPLKFNNIDLHSINKITLFNKILMMTTFS